MNDCEERGFIQIQVIEPHRMSDLPPGLVEVKRMTREEINAEYGIGVPECNLDFK